MKAVLFLPLQPGDLAHHLLLAGGELVDITCHRFLASRKLVDFVHYLLLRGGDSVYAVPRSSNSVAAADGEKGQLVLSGRSSEKRYT